MLLKDFLVKYGIKKKVFAKSIGISPTNLWKLLKQINNPSLKTARRIEEVTEGRVSIADLLDKESSEEQPKMPSLERRLASLEEKVSRLEQEASKIS